ncbi:hypothetical protein JSE7799_01243 [Jannaschia seosinensis]|uniref:Transposase n=1 Tax=Jannaschia seosinensis TaxID=313367 RepID=A0A0M7B8Z2_9RHOB|nr:hypothetical protein JSE7799_01243 [Jannaschia seosinensis]
MPPEAHRLVADVDAALVQQILDVPQRQRETDVHHHRQSDDLGAGLEVLEGAALGHATKLSSRPLRLKRSSSDKALANRVFESYDAIVGACCEAWNALIAIPERVASITSRDWAKVSG